MKTLLIITLILFEMQLFSQSIDWRVEQLDNGDQIILDIKFDFSFPTKENEQIQKLAEFLNFKTEIRSIQILQHTDCRGSNEVNLRLSQKRAEGIQYHLERHINRNINMHSIGRGENDPITIETDSGDIKLDCDYISQFRSQDKREELYSLNRRTEIIITEIDTSKKTRSPYANINFSPIKVNNIYQLPRIWFNYNKWTLVKNDSVNSVDSLKSLANFMKQNPNLIVEIMNHTDCRGSNHYSIRLSQKRAESIKQCLIEHFGISENRLIAKGYEENLPRKVILPNGSIQMLTCDYINSLPSKEDQEKAHQMNRRSEFKVLSVDYVEKE